MKLNVCKLPRCGKYNKKLSFVLELLTKEKLETYKETSQDWRRMYLMMMKVIQIILVLICFVINLYLCSGNDFIQYNTTFTSLNSSSINGNYF